MITFAALPKPFIGHIGIIQRNAIRSWIAQAPDIQVLLFGDDEGTAAVAAEFGCEHIPTIEKNTYGTPYLDDVFRKAEERSRHDILCYSNCDILLFPDYAKVAQMVASRFSHFLLLAECRNLWVRTPVDIDSPGWEGSLHAKMQAEGTRRPDAADFFTFRRGTFPSFPHFTLGRSYFDNGIIYEARRLGVPVIDATGRITAIHQNHYYTAVPGETAESHHGFEARENLQILGGKSHLYWICDRTHRLTEDGLVRDWESSLRLRRRWKAIIKKIRYVIVDALRALRLHS